MNKKLNKKLIISVLTAVILITAVTSGILIKKHKDVNDSTISGLGETKYEPKAIDTSNVTLNDETVGILNNEQENMDKYKKLIAEFNPSDKYLESINSRINEGYSMDDILIAYNFLNNNYGNINEISELLSKKKCGEKWDKVFESYNDKNKKFEPSDFMEGYIGNILNETSLTVDDIMIADHVSQKNDISIDDLIERRKNGEGWREIKDSLGIVNLEEKLSSVALSEDDIKRYTIKEKGKNDLSEDEIKDGIIIARKLNASEEKVINSIREGKTQNEIYADIYKEKYIN